jgi:hypothetical protein
MLRKGALADCYHYAGLRRLLVDFSHAGSALSVYDAGNQERICVPYRADELYPEPLYVKPGGDAVQYLDVAVIAGGCAHVKDPDGFS